MFTYIAIITVHKPEKYCTCLLILRLLQYINLRKVLYIFTYIVIITGHKPENFTVHVYIYCDYNST